MMIPLGGLPHGASVKKLTHHVIFHRHYGINNRIEVIVSARLYQVELKSAVNPTD